MNRSRYPKVNRTRRLAQQRARVAYQSLDPIVVSDTRRSAPASLAEERAIEASQLERARARGWFL